MRKIGGIYRDQYFDQYVDYLTEKTKEDRAKEGKAPYSPVTINTMATDTFYLEKHDDRDFGYWFKSDETMREAEKCLVKNLSGRNNPEGDARYYITMMGLFGEFLKEKK